MTRTTVLDRLQGQGILPTPQRVEVAEILMEKPQHLSAEQIIDTLKARGSRVSKATVYNTLNLFAEHGLVRELMVDPERKFYDSCTSPHHHFYNVDTRELSDIDSDSVKFLSLPELPEGTVQDGIEVLIKVRSNAAD